MSLYKQVLIPTDFSMAAWNAVQHGMKMLGDGGVLTLLHVYPSQAKFSTPVKLSMDDNYEILSELKNQMDVFCKQLQGNEKIQVKAVLLEGNVDQKISEYISSNPVDILLMGVNSNATDNHPGSHLNGILASTQVPLMVIPNQLEKAPAA